LDQAWPNGHPAAQAYQKAIYADDIPATAFTVDDIQKECERVTQLGVAFRSKPAPWIQ